MAKSRQSGETLQILVHLFPVSLLPHFGDKKSNTVVNMTLLQLFFECVAASNSKLAHIYKIRLGWSYKRLRTVSLHFCLNKGSSKSQILFFIAFSGNEATRLMILLFLPRTLYFLKKEKCCKQ